MNKHTNKTQCVLSTGKGWRKRWPRTVNGVDLATSWYRKVLPRGHSFTAQSSRLREAFQGCVQLEVAHWLIPCKSLEDWLLSCPGWLRRVLVLGPFVSSQFWVLHITSLVSEAFQSETLCLVCSFAFLQGGNKKKMPISFPGHLRRGLCLPRGLCIQTVTWSVSGTDTRLT